MWANDGVTRKKKEANVKNKAKTKKIREQERKGMQYTVVTWSSICSDVNSER